MRCFNDKNIEITAIFVYGTLRKNDPSGKFAILGEVQTLGAGRVNGRLFDLGEYPGAVPTDCPADQIVGEVYLLRNFSLQIQRLDEYEGTEYRREKIGVTLETGDLTQAWIYWYCQTLDGNQRIYSGDWLAR